MLKPIRYNPKKLPNQKGEYLMRETDYSSLSACLADVPDRRDERGKRYYKKHN